MTQHDDAVNETLWQADGGKKIASGKKTGSLWVVSLTSFATKLLTVRRKSHTFLTRVHKRYFLSQASPFFPIRPRHAEPTLTRDGAHLQLYFIGVLFQLSNFCCFTLWVSSSFTFPLYHSFTLSPVLVFIVELCYCFNLFTLLFFTLSHFQSFTISCIHCLTLFRSFTLSLFHRFMYSLLNFFFYCFHVFIFHSFTFSRVHIFTLSLFHRFMYSLLNFVTILIFSLFYFSLVHIFTRLTHFHFSLLNFFTFSRSCIDCFSFLLF